MPFSTPHPHRDLRGWATPAYFGMLKRQMNGEIDSWAIRWYYTVFAHDGLAVFRSYW
jgi:hypothetical protein